MISEQRLKGIEEIASRLNGLAMVEAASAMRELLAEVRSLRSKTTVTVELSVPLRERLDDLKQRIEGRLKTVAEVRALHAVRIDGSPELELLVAEQARPSGTVGRSMAGYPVDLVIEEDPEAPLAPAHHPV